MIIRKQNTWIYKGPVYSKRQFVLIHYLICFYLMFSVSVLPTFNWIISIYANFLFSLLLILLLPILFKSITIRIISIIGPILFIPLISSIITGNFDLISNLFIIKTILFSFLILFYTESFEYLKHYAIFILIGSFLLIFFVIFLYLSGDDPIDLKNIISQRMLFGLFSSYFLICYCDVKIKIFSFVYVALFCFLILLLGSRSAFLAGFFSIFIFFVLTDKPNILYILKRLIVFIALVGILLFIYFDKFISYPTIHRLMGIFELDNLVSNLSHTGIMNLRGEDRIDIIKLTWHLFLQKPWLGYGFGNFDMYSRYVYTHSVYLELLFAGGILTLLFFVAYLLSNIYFHIRLFFENFAFESKYNGIVVAIYTGIIIYGFFYPIFYSQLLCLFIFLGDSRFYYLRPDLRKN